MRGIGRIVGSGGSLEGKKRGHRRQAAFKNTVQRGFKARGKVPGEALKRRAEQGEKRNTLVPN